MKILILRFSSIGDIVLTTPVIRCLKKKFPNAEIHYATKASFVPLLSKNPYLTSIHVLNNSLTALIKELKMEKFDYIIDLHHNLRTFLIKVQLGVKSFSFYKANFVKWLLVNFKINHLPQNHIVNRYLDTSRNLGADNDGEGLDYFIAEEDEVNIRLLPTEFQNGYAAWVIGGIHGTKIFPAEKIIRIINQLNIPVILLGGKEDIERGETVKTEISNQQSEIINACGKYSLNQSASLVRQSKLVVTNDTGLMHVAAAFKKPVISFWGNTIPEFGFEPYYGKHKIRNHKFEIRNLECRPCSKLGYTSCPQKHFNCMNLLDEKMILEKIQELFRN